MQSFLCSVIAFIERKPALLPYLFTVRKMQIAQQTTTTTTINKANQMKDTATLFFALPRIALYVL